MKNLILALSLISILICSQRVLADQNGLAVCRLIQDLPGAQQTCFQTVVNSSFDPAAARQCARFVNLPSAIIRCLQLTANRRFDGFYMNNCPNQTNLPDSILKCVKGSVR